MASFSKVSWRLVSRGDDEWTFFIGMNCGGVEVEEKITFVSGIFEKRLFRFWEKVAIGRKIVAMSKNSFTDSDRLPYQFYFLRRKAGPAEGNRLKGRSMTCFRFVTAIVYGHLAGIRTTAEITCKTWVWVIEQQLSSIRSWLYHKQTITSSVPRDDWKERRCRSAKHVQRPLCCPKNTEKSYLFGCKTSIPDDRLRILPLHGAPSLRAGAPTTRLPAFHWTGLRYHTLCDLWCISDWFQARERPVRRFPR